MIQQILDDLYETWGYTAEELADIRCQMVKYAASAVLDSKVRQELTDELNLDLNQ